ncbi:MAG: type II toxin-antitoxin system Phd/YefM family antitoxin [Candidatus Levybacteria bacterium]|nr:type II toxin-antitoxin system Phd/YefM family antitoxin [Candidatus Levybacteria bacterium]
MNIVNATTLRNHLADTLKEVTGKRNFFLVSKKGEISSALVNIDLFEDLLTLTDTDYLASIRKARKEYKSGDVLSHDQVFGEL